MHPYDSKMRYWQRWVLWLPVAMTFGVTIAVAGFGLGAITSSPGAFVFTLFVALVAAIQGLLLGLVVIVATKLVNRMTNGPLSTWRPLSKIILHAATAGVLVAPIVAVYMSLAPPRIDHPSIVGPVLVVALVAALGAALSAWGRMRAMSP